MMTDTNPKDYYSIIEASIKMFEAFKSGDRSAIHPNIRRAVYAMALKPKDGEGRKAYNALLAFSQDPKNADEVVDTLTGLGNVREPDCMQSLLDHLLTDKIKTQEVWNSTSCKILISKSLTCYSSTCL
jgi:aminopeptidase 2